jgi:serine/threonine-protein kinase
MELATLDEEEGLFAAAARRWECELADEIDNPEALAHLARLRRQLRAGPRPAVVPGVAQTLAQPEGPSLSRYELVREIGHGTTSTVYLARDRNLGIPLALKVFHPPARLTDACRRFFAEARLVAGLRHPGVVAVYDLDEANRTLVMEYLPGGNLRGRLAAVGSSGLPATEAAGLARSLLAALAYVHACGVVHGDISPRNILYRSPEEPVLADFGSARRLAIDDADNELAAGTPIYLAPEQLSGAPSSPLTDLFAVGAILWEALAGRPLRRQADLLAGRLGPAARALPLRDECPDSARLAALITSLTDNEPSKRPSSAAEALRAIEGYSSSSSSGSLSRGGSSP